FTNFLAKILFFFSKSFDLLFNPFSLYLPLTFRAKRLQMYDTFFTLASLLLLFFKKNKSSN
ncbi:MAG: hypothetical protein AB8E82_05270, partial [Aureispira sp.]